MSKCTIEETKQMLDNYYYEVDHETMFYDIEEEMMQIVVNQLHLPQAEAYKFVCDWFDNRH